MKSDTATLAELIKLHAHDLIKDLVLPPQPNPFVAPIDTPAGWHNHRPAIKYPVAVFETKHDVMLAFIYRML
jgi:hypothetical protein